MADVGHGAQPGDDASGGDPALRARIALLESTLRAHGIAVPGESMPPVPPVPPLPPAPPVLPVPQFLSTAPPHAVARPVAPAAAPAPDGTVERALGMRIAAVLGSIAVLAALVFFIQYGIETGLFGHLGPGTKFACCLGLAAALLIAGEIVLRRSTRDASVGLTGCGVLVLFGSIAGGVYVLELFGPVAAGAASFGAALVGCAVSRRSESLVVASMGVLGGFAVPVITGTLTAPGLIGGICLSANLLLALAMTAVGPPKFALLRTLALPALAIGALVWIVETDPAPAVVALGAGLWWGAIAASCLTQALRGRSRRSNASVLVLASLAAACAGLEALGGASAWTHATAYVPLGIGACLVLLAVQFDGARRDRERFAADPALRRNEELDDAAMEVVRATGLLAAVAAATASTVLLLGATALLDVDQFAAAAGALAAAQVLVARRTRHRWMQPGTIIAALAALVTCVVARLQQTSTDTAWLSLPATSTNPASVGALLHVSFGPTLLWPVVGALLLLLPEWTRRRASVGSVATAIAGLLALQLCLITPLPDHQAPIGLWTASLLGSAAVLLAAAVRAQRGPRLLMAMAILALLHWCLGLTADRAPGWLHLAVLAPASAALWSCRGRFGPTAAPWIDAAAATSFAGGVALMAVSKAHEDRDAGVGAVVVAMVATAAASAALSLLRRWRPTVPLAVAAATVLIPSLLLLAGMATAVVADFDLSADFHGPGAWKFATLAPLVALVLATGRLPEAARTAPALRHGAPLLRAATGLASALCIVAELAPAQARPAWIIGALLLSGIAATVLGFRRDSAGARWSGLALLGALALRLFLVDLREISPLLRVGLLLATGLVLVGASIAYALLLRPGRKPPPAG